MSQPIKVGVFIPEAKWERMGLRQITPEKYGIEMIDALADAELSQVDLSKFDAILHKFTYQLVDGHAEDVKKVAEYTKAHPELIVIEPIENINVFVSRIDLQNFIHQHPLPSQFEYVDGILLTPDTDLSSLPYPVLVKAESACGTAESHKITLAHSSEQIPKADYQQMAFPFIPHKGVVFKCYALGDHFVMRRAKSLSVKTTTQTTFDSQKPIPTEIAGDEQNESQNPSDEDLSSISEALQKMTGVQLIGFDLLRRESDGKLCLVDFNYFPCFRGIDDVAGKFAQFIKEKVQTVRK